MSAGFHTGNGTASCGPISSNPENYLLREHLYLSKITEANREIAKYKKIANDIQTRFEESFYKTSLRFAMVDPCVNMEILRLRQKLKQKDNEIDTLKQEVASQSFKPTSISGQKLMKKCRVLLEENQSLGRQITEGPIQDLLVALAAERERARKLGKKVGEMESTLNSLDEENERLTQALDAMNLKLSAQGGAREEGGSGSGGVHDRHESKHDNHDKHDKHDRHDSKHDRHDKKQRSEKKSRKRAYSDDGEKKKKKRKVEEDEQFSG